MDTDTHKKLMYAVIFLAVVHGLLSALVLAYSHSITTEKLKIFLVVSIIVNIIIAAYACWCIKLNA